MTVTTDQTGLSKDKLKKGDKVQVIRVADKMVLVSKDKKFYWINEKYLSDGTN